MSRTAAPKSVALGIDLSPGGGRLAFAGLHNASNPLGTVSEPLFLRSDWDSRELLRSRVSKDKAEGIGLVSLLSS